MTLSIFPPDLGRYSEIPMDGWTRPFWDAAARKALVLPRCGDCGSFRWPPGPFCPKCRSQVLDWVPAGRARLYSFTVVRQKPQGQGDAARHVAPGLVEFPACGGVRLMAAIIDTPREQIRIGADLDLRWTDFAGFCVPQFVVRTD